MAKKLGQTKYQSELLVVRLEEKLTMLAQLTDADEAAVTHLLDLVRQSGQLRHSASEDGYDGD